MKNKEILYVTVNKKIPIHIGNLGPDRFNQTAPIFTIFTISSPCEGL